MLDFTYANRTKMVFGRTSVKQVGELAKEHGKRVLIVYGQDSCKRSGLLQTIKNLLAEKQLDAFELGGVEPNPKMNLAYQGIEICKKEKIDFILAIGGGSVIDTSKTIGMGACYNGDAWDFYTGVQAETALPVGVVLTIPAAGSESSMDAVMTKEDGKLKRPSCSGEFIRPVFAILNPELTYTLPPFQTACGATDIIAHVLERYFTTTSAVDVTDRLCEALVQSVVKATPKVLQNPEDYDSRAEIMLAGSFAHNNMVGIGRAHDWASHNMGHEVSALTEATHGATLAVIFPAWMKYVYKHDLTRFAQFANRIFNVPYMPGEEESMALEGIRRFRLFLADIGLPTNLGELNVKREDIPVMAKKCHSAGGFVKLNENDIARIYESAL